MAANKLEVVNAALTRVGEERLAVLTGTTVFHELVNDNYDIIVGGQLSSQRYRWAITSTHLGAPVAGTSIDGWAYTYQLPADLLQIIWAHREQLSFDYDIKSNKLLTDENTADRPITIDYVWNVPEDQWPGDFTEGIVTMWESIFLRSKERYDEATSRERSAIVKLQDAQTVSAQTRKAQRRTRSRLADARRGR